jgi:hypothetical protein
VRLQKCCTWGTKGSKRQTKSACDSRRSAGAADRAEHNLVLTSRLPAAVAIFDVIAGCDPADPVIAASQGKWADSYLRFLDKDGAHGARLGVVHQLFTSEDADPGAMARALARNVSGSRRQGRAAAVGSVKGRSPAPTGTGKMRRFQTFPTPTPGGEPI